MARKDIGWGTILNAVLTVVIALALLITAIVQAWQGDWLAALFFAVLWVGYSNNNNMMAQTKLLSDRTFL